VQGDAQRCERWKREEKKKKIINENKNGGTHILDGELDALQN
jgi:hypothetical protein